MNTRLLFMHALSPLHPGTGQGVGVIDLPIAREKATGLPFFPGSSLKGVLRDMCTDQDKRSKVFGPEQKKGDEYAGSIQISDQRLLLFPVRSVTGTFAWVTSPFLLNRLKRDMKQLFNDDVLNQLEVPELAAIDKIIINSSECTINTNGKVLLEDLDLNEIHQESAGKWAEWIGEGVFPEEDEWKNILKSRFAIVHDDVLNFLVTNSTEINARIRLDEDSKTVVKGGLWYEEALPAETILFGLLVATPVAKTELSIKDIFSTVKDISKKPMQLGGNATTGRGFCQLQVTDPNGGE